MLHNFIMSGSLIGSAEKFAKGGGVGKKYTVTDIKYDTDGEDIDLPTEMEITVPKGMTDSEEILEFISDEISDRTGFSHEGFSTDPQIFAKGGGVAEGWTDADLMAKGGKVEVFEISKPKDLEEFWAKKENADKTIFFVEEMEGDGTDDMYFVVGEQTKKFYEDHQYWDYDGVYHNVDDAVKTATKKAKTTKGGVYAANLNVIRGFKDGGGVAEGWTDAELMAKGGGVKQKGTSVSSLDKLEKAKRVGYRFTDKKAKQLHLGANAKPTAEEIKKMKNGKGVYYENRKNRSDKSRMKKLEDGGVAEGWTDAELLEKGGAAKAKKKGGGNSGMMAKIQSGAKALRAEHPSMKWTDCIKKSAANLKAKGELHN